MCSWALCTFQALFICASCSNVLIFLLLFPARPPCSTHWKESKVHPSWALPTQVSNVNLHHVVEIIWLAISFPGSIKYSPCSLYHWCRWTWKDSDELHWIFFPFGSGDWTQDLCTGFWTARHMVGKERTNGLLIQKKWEDPGALAWPWKCLSTKQQGRMVFALLCHAIHHPKYAYLNTKLVISKLMVKFNILRT